MKHLMLPIALCLAVTMPAIAAETPEEIVLQAYAKAAFSNQVRLIEENVYENKREKDFVDRILKENQLTFALSDLKAGGIVGNTNPISSIATNPTGKQVLEMTLVHRIFKLEALPDRPEAEVEGYSLKVQWREAMNYPAEAWTMPISYFANEGWPKYLTFHVAAEYQGKSFEYEAYFLFDENGKVWPRDPFIENGGFDNLITTSVYPTLLLRTPYGEDQRVQRWLRANQMSLASCQPRAVCCDTAAMRCGILPSDLEDELSNNPYASTPEGTTSPTPCVPEAPSE